MESANATAVCKLEFESFPVHALFALVKIIHPCNVRERGSWLDCRDAAVLVKTKGQNKKPDSADCKLMCGPGQAPLVASLHGCTRAWPLPCTNWSCYTSPPPPQSLLSSEKGEMPGFLAINMHSPTTYTLPTTPVSEAHTRRLRCAGVPAHADTHVGQSVTLHRVTAVTGPQHGAQRQHATHLEGAAVSAAA